jgi:outer membrane protein OmpA-like peptidoglycan-associated protein
MKTLFIALSLLCFTTFSYSQLRMAVLGGPLSASVKETNSIPGWESKIKPGYSSHSGLNLGVLVDVSVGSNVFFQPGIMYMAKGRKFYMSNDSTTSIITDTISGSSNLSVNYIEAPLNLAYKVTLGRKAKFVLSAGPYLGFFYNGKQKFETRIYSTNDFKNDEQRVETGKGEGKIKTVDVGYNVRAGFEIGNILLSGFLSRGLTSFYRASYNGTFRHHVAGASIGFWLTKAKERAKVSVVTIPIKEEPAAVSEAKDTDGDGILDQSDACPDVAGIPEFNGCPIPDSDMDGLNDTEDKCPTEAGPAENSGCPVIKQDSSMKEVEKKMNFAARNIFFNANSDQLTINSTIPLDEIVSLLLANSSVRITIEGHTDTLGKQDVNKSLSQKRAETVKNYLVQNGVEESRVTAVGYGSEKPIDTNKTADGRAKNRRVELKLHL